MINEFLFVYGSLLDADNEFVTYLNNNSILIGSGSFKGRLYDIGEYPGAIIDSENGYPITGTIYKLNNTETFTLLDDYEGFGPDQDQPNLFIRELLPVETSDGIRNCWVYLFNLSVEGLTEITSSDYKSYIKQK
ncbi:MAG: gamma-glutamylcyclotransferase [Mucilaginibacter sp.]|nr:gamma-glutamylcyclotransferase [Mucilaginibacter sp.]